MAGLGRVRVAPVRGLGQGDSRGLLGEGSTGSRELAQCTREGGLVWAALSWPTAGPGRGGSAATWTSRKARSTSDLGGRGSR